MRNLKKLFFLVLLLTLTIQLVGCKQNKSYDMEPIQTRRNFLSVLKQYRERQPLFDFSMQEKATDDGVAFDSSNNGGSNDYSKTNTQVAGIDEADVVKTDGAYIYSISQGRVLITRAYPLSQAGSVKTLEVDDNFVPSSLYIDEEHLVVIGNKYDIGENKFAEDDVYYYHTNLGTRIYVYDKRHLDEAIHTLDFDGYRLTTRKIGDEVILITNKYVNVYDDDIKDDKILPQYQVNEESKTIGYDDIHYQDGTYPSGVVTIFKFDVKNPEESLDYFTYLGQSNTVYVSHDNVYVAQQVYSYNRVGILEGSVKDQEQVVQESKTFVSKVNYEEDLTLVNSIYVKGVIRNQFMMDEHKGDFRITTTRGNTWDDTSTNNLYVYDENLNEKGKLEGLAKGESIQSTRFMGDRVYLVTFKQVDPFFVIDASNPSDPTLLGELKIPGFSTYLHPYDEQHIIGFGFEADLNGRTTGLKISLFDVTDPGKPIEKFKEVMTYEEMGYSHSEVTYNHKALLFDKSKNIIAFPFSSNSYEVVTTFKDGKMVQTHEYTFSQEYLVYGLDLTNGFEMRATITHFDEGKSQDYYYLNEISRGLYIDDYLYTVSESKVVVHDLENLELVQKIALPVSDQPVYHYYPYYRFMD